MSRCNRCHVDIMDETLVCPLCHGVLESNNAGENQYPDAGVRTKRLKFCTNLFFFLVLLISALCGYVNYIWYRGIWWSLIAGFGMLYAFLIFRFAVIGNSGYRAKMTVMTFLAVVYIIMIDFVLGYRGWSVNYVLPSAIILTDIGIGILMIVNARNWQSYLMFQLSVIVCSVIPLFLAWFHIVTKPQLSILAFAISVFLFLGSLILGDKRARTELKRRFHVR